MDRSQPAAPKDAAALLGQVESAPGATLLAWSRENRPVYAFFPASSHDAAKGASHHAAAEGASHRATAEGASHRATGADGASHLGRRLVVVGGVHGDERASVETALRALEGGVVSGAAGAVVVVPALNPDGLLRGRKDNGAGVDLNRNFAAANWSAQHPAGYHPGAGPLSEPETAALAQLIESFAPSAVLAIHAPFACVNYDGPAAAWAEAIAAACGWPVRADLGYPTPGSLGSWLGRDRGLPVVTLELPAGDFRAFSGPATAALRAAIRHAPPVG